MENTKQYLKIILTSLLLLTTYSIPILATTELTTLYVDDDNTTGPWDGTPTHPYQNIQDAIDAATDGTTIYVYNGTYYENLIIDKLLTINGQNKHTTIIDGNNTNKVISIPHENVILTDFTIQNSGYFVEDAGIYLRANNIQIINTIITHNTEGILLRDTQGTIIQNNIILNCEYGLYLINSNSNNQLLDNHIHTNMIGINLQESSNNNINSNTIQNNEYGIRLKLYCDTNAIAGNNIQDNTKLGIELDQQCIRNIIFHNNFIQNNQHAYFSTSFLNIWRQNYWDNWIGIEFDGYEELPKFLLGRLFGPIPWINFDLSPQKIPFLI